MKLSTKKTLQIKQNIQAFRHPFRRLIKTIFMIKTYKKKTFIFLDKNYKMIQS